MSIEFVRFTFATPADWFQSLVELRVSTLVCRMLFFPKSLCDTVHVKRCLVNLFLQITVLCVLYTCTWLAFALLYYSIALKVDTCFENMDNFNAAFVFSIATQERNRPLRAVRRYRPIQRNL